MGRKSSRAKLILSQEEREQLERLAGSRTAERREIERSQILLGYAEEKEISQIATEAGVSRPTVYKCVDKALSSGVSNGLKDLYHCPKKPEITEESKAWVRHLACNKPKGYGLAAEFWSNESLAVYVRKHCKSNGHNCLKKANASTVWRILNQTEIKPHKMEYYLEKRDERFEEKMHEVLTVYREVFIEQEKGNRGAVVTVSVDEKPGIQAIANTAPDLAPKPNQHRNWKRDHEYKRLGTVSLLAALDLHTGHVIGQVQDRHRSVEFIELLKALDEYYLKDHQIRIILDNHSAHISKETRAYLATRPNRFIYVHTPTHGSWLNLVETLFGKMARTFLKRIRVQSIEELKARILKGIDEINQSPVIHRWTKFEIGNVKV